MGRPRQWDVYLRGSSLTCSWSGTVVAIVVRVFGYIMSSPKMLAFGEPIW